jgi:HSP20 family protein
MRILTPQWTNRSLASDLMTEMDQFFNDWTPTNRSEFYDERSFNPACEISETEEHFMMSVDLPGTKKSDIKIEVANDILTVSGERKRESMTDKKAKLQHFERSYGFFKRSFSLPTSIDADKVEARYEEGVLELYLPKVHTAKPRQIEIQSDDCGIFDRLLGSKKNNQDAKNVSTEAV